MKFSYATIGAAVLAGATNAVDEYYSGYGEYVPYEEEQCPDFTDREHLDTPDYQELSAYCKMQNLWANITNDTTVNRFFVGADLKKLFTQDMNLTYDVVSDTMPPNRVKRTHPVGTHTKVEFIAHPDSPYTGCFRGFKHGIVRISETTQTTPEVAKTAPGYGLKCLRDGMASGNMLTMFAFDGQPSFNFFKNRWTTILKEMDN